MRVEIKNQNYSTKKIASLFNFLVKIKEGTIWNYCGLSVEIDPTFDFKGDDALIRWTDIHEGFNDKLIVNSLQEFQSNFHLLNA